jgi:hypothetical protein
MMGKLFLVVVFWGLFCGAFVQAQTTQQWREDLEFLRRELPRKHVNLFFSMSPEEFNREMDQLVSHLDTLSKNNILVGLQRLVARIGDSHTSISFPVSSSERLPVNTRFFADGVYITEGIPEMLHMKILSINGFEIGSILDSLALLEVCDNSSMFRNRMPRYLSNLIALRHFGFVLGNTFLYQCQDTSGMVREFRFSVRDFQTMKQKSVKASLPGERYPFFRPENDFFWQEFQEDDSVYYVRYKRCASRLMNFFIKYFLFEPRDIWSVPSFHKFSMTVRKDLKHLPVKKLVFDLRENGGGSSHQGTSLIRKIARNKVINQQGKIFVLIDRGTFSSAFLNTLDFKNFTHAITVGESPSQPIGSYGDTRSFLLPHSGLKVACSTKYFPSDSRQGDRYIPDIEVPVEFLDYIRGTDRAYQDAMDY